MDRLVPVAEKFGYRPDVIVCPSDVPAGRPFPWMMYRNLIELGVYPIEAVVKVGDTLPDIEEGLNAGCWTVVVTKTGNELGLTETEVSEMDNTELTKKLASIEEKFWKAGAHYVIESVAALPPVIEEIQNRLRRGERP
jgi:phosphonoacetaldehyde hydrolase